MDPIVRQIVESVVGLLVNGEYEALANMTSNRRLTADQLRSAIEEYGRTLVPLPDGWPSDPHVSVVQVDDPNRTTLVITVDFWTVEEGRSDLSMELRLTEVGRGLWETQIDDIRVL